MEFSQKGPTTTIHDFGLDLEWQKEELNRDARKSSVIIPMLYSELKRPAIRTYISELNKCTYLNKIYISLKAGSKKEFQDTSNFFDRLDVPCEVIWSNGSRITKILDELNKEDIGVSELKGKGKDMWIAMGIASLDAHAIAFVDADIITFNDALITKLLFPVSNPKLDFFFNKAFYTRMGLKEKKMYGRVYRLFVSPLIESLIRKFGRRSSFLDYLNSFKYPLSGEFSLTSDLALNIRIPGDWGVEMGILSEVFRSASLKRVCQTDTGFHDHKHRKIGDKNTGLIKMAGEIEKSILRSLVEIEGVDITHGFLQSLQVLYKRIGQDRIHSYDSDSTFNALVYDRHQEERALERFSNIILTAGEDYIKNPFGTIIPSWSRVLSAQANLRHDLRDAALKDLREL